MSTFTGKKIANTYKNLLQVDTSNTDLSTTLKSIQTGAGNTTPLQLSTDKINLTGTVQISGTTLTANAATLNAVADLTGTTGVVAVSAGTVYGRTIEGTAPITISNGNGTEGNPSISLATTGITSATYGPLGKFNIDTFGRVISVSVATTVSANAFVGGTLSGSALTVENNTSIGGDLVIAGTTNMKAVSATDVTLNNLTVGTKITAATVTATTVETSVLRATRASITDLTADSLSFSDTSVSSLNATNLFAVSANATRLFKAGVTVGTETQIAAVSALTKTNLDAITSINTVVAGVSALTKTNLDAITSINTVVTSVNSLAVAVSALTKTNLDAVTSINTVVAGVSALTKTNLDAVTSINTVVANVSALTKTNLDAITSINTVTTNLSATMATSIANRTAAITSINTVVGNLSATMATSIGNRTSAITSINTVVANVSALTKTNLDAVTSINTVVTNLSATMATSIANVSALTKTNLDAVTSINTVVANVSSTMATSIGNRTSAITSINTVITNLSATMATSIANVGALTSVSAFTINTLTVVSAVNGNLTLESTADGGPVLNLKSNDHGDAADWATESTIKFLADNSANEETEYANIQLKTTDVTDGTEDGWIYFGTKANGTLNNTFAFSGTGSFYLLSTNDDDPVIQWNATGGTSYDVQLKTATPTADRTITLPDATGTVSLLTATETLTNKTLTSPVINGFSGTGDGALTGNLTLTNTGAGAGANPNVKLYRNSSSPADNDFIGEVIFTGRNDNSEDVDYSAISSKITDASDGTEDSNFLFKVMSAGTLTTVLNLRGNASTKFSNKDVLLDQNVNLMFEGATSNGHETTLTVVDPTGDRTITLPDATGTVLTTGNSDTPATTTSSGDADFVLVDDGGTMKKITPSNLGISESVDPIPFAIALG